MKLRNLLIILAFLIHESIAQTPSLESKSFVKKQNSAFVENKGQIGDMNHHQRKDVKAVYQNDNLSVFLLPNGLAYQFTHRTYPQGFKFDSKSYKPEEIFETEELTKKIKTQTYRMDLELIGSNSEARVTMEGESEDYQDFYNVLWQESGITFVHSYNKVIYHNIYPGIDWIIYSSENGLKYDFLVHPNGKPSDIKIRFLHNESLSLQSDGSLTITNRMGVIMEKSPLSTQDENTIETKFELKNGILTFKIGNYDTLKSLIIDPSISWATYYGGTSTDNGRGCAVDGAGNVYIAGETISSTNIASGGHQTTIGGDFDAYMVKFNSSGTRLWATYYGSTAFDVGVYCCIDPNNFVYLCGHTNSSSMASGGHQNAIGGSNDAFLVKFNSAGTRQWATYYGGSSSDFGTSCASDGSGNIFLSGYTSSSNAISSSGHQNTYSGNTDGFLVKFNSSGVRQWGTYYGGSNVDVAATCTPDALGNIFLVGYTSSNSSIATTGSHQDTIGGNEDAFMAKFDGSGSRIWATYYGGSLVEEGRVCVIDGQSNVFLGGQTTSHNSISSNGDQDSIGGGNDNFLVKFNVAGVRQWATYSGGMGNEGVGHCIIGSNNVIYLSGNTTSINSIALDAYQDTLGGQYDLYLSKYTNSGERIFSTYYGGSNLEGGAICAFAGNEDVYLCGSTYSTSNVAKGGYQNTFGGVADALLVKINTALAQISISGNNQAIVSGDTIPNIIDNTDFGAIKSGAVKSLQFKVKNTGTDTLIFTGTPKISVNGINASEFIVTNTLPNILLPNDSVNFIIEFGPIGSGLKRATISLSSNIKSKSPYTFRIQGTGLVPLIELKGSNTLIQNGDLTPAFIDSTNFGSAKLSNSKTVRYKIFNKGNDTLKLNGSPIINITGTNASDFNVISSPSSSILPSDSSYFIIEFKPSSKGLKVASVSIPNNTAANNPYTFSVQGNGIASEIEVKGNNALIQNGDFTPVYTDSTDFGSLNLSKAKTVTYKIFNKGTDTLKLTGTPLINISGINATDFNATTQPSSSILPSDSSYFVIEFKPTALGLKVASVSINNNTATNTLYTFAIQGNCMVNGINTSDLKAIQIYPVPSEGDIILKNVADYNSLSIMDQEGRIVTDYSIVNTFEGIRIITSKLSAGIYIISINSEENSNIIKKVIINK